jgi:hypothetical protein
MVHRVDLMTRLINDPAVPKDYGQEEERIAPGKGELGGAFIVRLPAGDSNVYLPKEELWPHVRGGAPPPPPLFRLTARAVLVLVSCAGHRDLPRTSCAGWCAKERSDDIAGSSC